MRLPPHGAFGNVRSVANACVPDRPRLVKNVQSWIEPDQALGRISPSSHALIASISGLGPSTAMTLFML